MNRIRIGWRDDPAEPAEGDGRTSPWSEGRARPPATLPFGGAGRREAAPGWRGRQAAPVGRTWYGPLAEPREDRAEPDPARLRVLYAEDNLVHAQVMSELLKIKSIECRIAINGADAVRMFEELRFDMVLMDVRMPEMDGLAAARAIRTAEALSGADPVPIVGVSADPSDAERRACTEAGMDAHLSKPVRLEQLTDLIARLLRIPLFD